MALGALADSCEREADRIAGRVVDGAVPASDRCAGPPCPASVSAGQADAPVGALAPGVEARIDALRGHGQPLDAATRVLFESRLGHSFGRVRVHADPRAAGLAATIGARAFTVGNDLFFGAGEYAAGTARGRRLLAHELAHVVRGAASDGAVPAVVRRVPTGDDGGASPVETAIRGDDDVRALTRRSDWSELDLSAESCALLLVNLLRGAALTPDEQAGLRILERAVELGRLDDTLRILQDRGHFGELIASYHGDERGQLLELLAQHIEALDLQAAVLEAVLAGPRVGAADERALVTLLERLPVVDQVTLLEGQDRQSRVRRAIDDEALSRRYERIARNVNVQRGTELASQLARLFTIPAEASVTAGRRTEAEVTELLRAAADDLSSELGEYRQALDDALGEATPRAADLARINRAFEERLDRLIADTQAEFGFELRYNVEFRRSLDEARGRTWSRRDLERFDRWVLSHIPDEILRINPRFRQFVREGISLRYAATALAPEEGEPGRIQLHGAASRATTYHELGHMAHFFDDALLEDFQRLSGWQLLSADDFLMLISDREDREDLLNELREDRAGEHESHSHRRGEHVYRYNLYGDGYWRHRRDAEFVSLYARVHPEEDFAESFRTYFRSPSRLRRQCPQKYEFMRARLPGLIAEAQAELALGEFDAESDRLLETVPEAGGFRARTEGHIAALRQRLGLDLAAGAEGAPPARTEPGETPGPTDVEDTRARDIGRALRPSVQALVDLGASLGRRYEEFAAGIEAREATVEPALRAQFPWLGREVLRDLARELLEMQDAAAEAIVSREEAGGASVEEQLEAPIARSARALDVIESYLPIYYAATSVPMDLVHLLEDDPSLSARQQDEVRARFRLLRDEMTTLVSEIQARIAAGTPASAPPELPDPSARLREHEEAIFTLETGGAEPVAGSR